MEGNKSDIVELLKQTIKIFLHSGFLNLILFKERRNDLPRRTLLTNQPPDLRPDHIEAEIHTSTKIEDHCLSGKITKDYVFRNVEGHRQFYEEQLSAIEASAGRDRQGVCDFCSLRTRRSTLTWSAS